MSDMTKKALTLYHDIDRAIDSHYKTHKKQPPCSNGCASCCSQFFEVSELEFELISEMINTWSTSDKNKLLERADILFDTFKEYWPNFAKTYFASDTINLNTDDYFHDLERFDISMPCVFLSPTGSCTVYGRRPNICRTTGVGFQYLINKGAVCDYIKWGMTTPLWQVDLRAFRNDIEELRWLEDPNHPGKYKRQYPMFYYVYDMLKHKT